MPSCAHEPVIQMPAVRPCLRLRITKELGGQKMAARYYSAFVGFVTLVTIQWSPQQCFAEFRLFDGTGNNLSNPQWGAAETNFARKAPVDYADGISAARLTGRPNPRSVGSALFRQTVSLPNARRLSGYVYAFGNFLSHDSQETISDTNELVPFRIPFGDDIFLPNQIVQLPRSRFDPATGTGPDNPRQQVNFATAFIDGSQIYGSDALTASILRGGPANPQAKLRTSNDINGDAENLLPRDAFGPAPNAPFVAGDSRVNDNIVLTAMHTLFMREHNRLVDVLVADHPDWTSEQLFQRARKTVGAELQAITFNEFLPALLGPYAPAATGDYDPDVNPAVLNEFPVVFLRIGHSMLPNEFKRVQNSGHPAPIGPLPLEQAFLNPAALTTSTDLDLFLKGLSVEIQEETDLKMVDGMRIALLDAIDIQRARDHGIPDYNTLREVFGLPRVTSFAEITSETASQVAMAAVYGDVNSLDPLVGAMAEDHLPGASVGPLVATAFRQQFERLRDGDRFWYEYDPDFTATELEALRRTRLADIIVRNSGVTNLRSNVFFAVPEPSALPLAFGTFEMLAATISRRRINWQVRPSMS
jgi:hypothetical protein